MRKNKNDEEERSRCERRKRISEEKNTATGEGKKIRN